MVPADSDKVSRASPYSGFLNEFLIFRIRGSHPFSLAFPHDSTILRLFPHILRSFNPDPQVGLGSFPFARHYLGNRFFFLFLRLLRCFSSPGSLCNTMDSCYSDGGLLRRVSPFRYPWIVAYLQLPMAFRSLSRLSSALSAKASTLRSF